MTELGSRSTGVQIQQTAWMPWTRISKFECLLSFFIYLTDDVHTFARGISRQKFLLLGSILLEQSPTIRLVPTQFRSPNPMPRVSKSVVRSRIVHLFKCMSWQSFTLWDIIYSLSVLVFAEMTGGWPLAQITGLSSVVVSKLRFLVRHTAWILAQVSSPPTCSPDELPDGKFYPPSSADKRNWGEDLHLLRRR